MRWSGIPELVLAEDAPEDEALSLRAISRTGIACQVTVQRDGEAALAHILDMDPVRLALVILDFRMPKRSGLEVLQELRKQPALLRVPVVMFCGETTDQNVKRFYQAGANSCVAKPTDPVQYVEHMLEVASYWLGVNSTALRLPASK